MAQTVTFGGGKQFFSTDNGTHGTSPQYPSDGIGGETATEGNSILVGANRTWIYEVLMIDAAGTADVWTMQYHNGSTWVTFYVQAMAAAVAAGNYVSFGNEGIAVPGPIRVTAADAAMSDILITFKSERSQ